MGIELNIGLSDAEKILSVTQRRRAPPLTQSGAALMTAQSKKYSTYCEPLNELLGGGLSPGNILEISGPPGTAKETLAINIVRSFVEAEHDILFLGLFLHFSFEHRSVLIDNTRYAKHDFVS